MPDPLLDLPLDAINASALPRDRTALDPDALSELQTSIATTGLRQPIEVFELATPEGPCRYGLISGLRRLTAIRNLAEMAPARFPTIAAFLRAPQSLPEAVAAMVEENDIRADLSPWEKARIVTQARNLSLFPTLDAAIDALYANAGRQRRARLRALALVVEELEGCFTDPDLLTQRQMLRLAAACRGGFSDLIAATLEETKTKDPVSQWSALQNVLLESESEARAPSPPDPRPGRPRRFIRPRNDLSIRREMLPEGWSLRFTGPEAKGALVEEIMDYIERMWGRQG